MRKYGQWTKVPSVIATLLEEVNAVEGAEGSCRNLLGGEIHDISLRIIRIMSKV